MLFKFLTIEMVDFLELQYIQGKSPLPVLNNPANG